MADKDFFGYQRRPGNVPFDAEFRVIDIEGEIRLYRTHKILLAASCQMLLNLFQYEPNKPYALPLPMTHHAMEALLDLIYLGKTTINKSNALDILRGADYLLCDKLVDIAKSYICCQQKLLSKAVVEFPHLF